MGPCNDLGRLARPFRLKDLGEPEIGDAGLQMLVEEDVARLDIAVDHRLVAAVVEILQPFGRAERDLVARFPIKRQLLASVQPIPQAAIRHVLVDQQARVLTAYAAIQLHHIHVPDGAQRLDLGLELAVLGAPRPAQDRSLFPGALIGVPNVLDSQFFAVSSCNTIHMA